VYLPVPWATHENGSSSSTWWRRELRWWEGTMAFAARWWGGRAYACAVIASLLMVVRIGIQAPGQFVTAWRAIVRDPMRARRAGTGSPQPGPFGPPSAR
jgi:hypothetical protein